ncbi:MAG: class I SAM-dependent RNA methyltransferase [Firmicutes bacterium]|nr:class I SAM-dependent RNA methyltransferase [Bacillota bacterium]
MNKINLIATSTFGLEAVVKRELKNLGFEKQTVLDGSIEFEAEISDIPRLNINLRSADRLLLVMGKFKAYSFEQLFDNTYKLPWGDILPKDANFIVTGKSIKSTLYSVPDCQSIVEKAVVEKLKQKYKINWFEKSGAIYKIQVAILKDNVTLTVDTSGAALHKRGYRESQVIAPVKETMAAAMIDLSFWRPDRLLLDPCCGSGTIPIEAALIAKNIAPGLDRKFVSEDWGIIDKKYWKDARKAAFSAINNDIEVKIKASDIDPRAIEIAKQNAENAGVDDIIDFDVMPFNKVRLTDNYGVCISNPPYAERMGVLDEVEQLYRDMGKLFRANKTWSVYIITSHEGFEKLYGKRADKKRKLFNGNVKIDYYQYFGERPPRG